MKYKHLNMYLSTAIERHKVYLKKEQGENKPWTEDPVYQNYFFCNVFRKYDKVTKWMIENIVPECERTNSWDLLVLYRYISTQDINLHLQNLGIHLDSSKVQKELQRMYDNGTLRFNGCFIRNTALSGGNWGKAHTVPFFIIDDIVDKFGPTNDWIRETSTLESMVKGLKNIIGTKGFMAYEYASDFEYTNFFNPTDKNSWANMGPGAQRGLSLVCYGDADHRFSEAEWLEHIRNILPKMQAVFKENFGDIDVSMREVEHWLCEFQKYVKYRRLHTKGTKCKVRKYDGR